MKRFIDDLHGLYTPFFNADGGEGGDGGSGAEDAGGEGDNGAEEDPGKRTVTMSQSDLDALIAREKARAKKPYADYDDLKTKLSDFEKAEEERRKAAMSEAERLQAEKDEAAKRATEAEERAAAALKSANQRLLKSEFKLKAAAAGVLADAIDDAFVLADLSEVSVNDEGVVDGESLEAAIKSLIESKPYLAATAKPKGPREIGDPSNPPDKSADKTKEQRLKEAADKARRTGKIEDRVAYAALKRELEG